jgi:hypothetical protein
MAGGIHILLVSQITFSNGIGTTFMHKFRRHSSILVHKKLFGQYLNLSWEIGTPRATSRIRELNGDCRVKSRHLLHKPWCFDCSHNLCQYGAFEHTLRLVSLYLINMSLIWLKLNLDSTIIFVSPNRLVRWHKGDMCAFTYLVPTT